MKIFLAYFSHQDHPISMHRTLEGAELAIEKHAADMHYLLHAKGITAFGMTDFSDYDWWVAEQELEE